MISLKIRLSTIEDVKCFVNTASIADFDIDLSSGRYTVDAKSIMGIFSLDLTKEITARVYTDDEARLGALREKLAKFIVT